MLTDYLAHEIIPLGSEMQSIVPDSLPEFLCGAVIRDFPMQVKRVAIPRLALCTFLIFIKLTIPGLYD